MIAVPPLFTSAKANASLSLTRMTRENLLSFSSPAPKLPSTHPSLEILSAAGKSSLAGGMCVLLFFLAFYSKMSAASAATLVFIIDGNQRFVKEVFGFSYARFSMSFLNRILNTILTKGCIKNNCVKNANGKFRHTSFSQFASSVQIQKPL